MSSNALNPSVVKTELDKVFYQEWDSAQAPGLATVENEKIFKQQGSNKAVEQRSVFVGNGAWEETGEGQILPNANSLIKDKVNYTMVKFAKSEYITKEFFDDDQHNDIDKIVREMAYDGRIKQNVEGFSVYRNAFNAAFPGGDGVSLVSASHPTSTGTASNLLTDKLTPDALNSAIISAQTQIAKDGLLKGFVPRILLVDPSNYKRACEIVDSEWLADTANNNINVYSSKYGLYVLQNPFVGRNEFGTATNLDAWFLLGDMHSVNRIVREPIDTNLIDWRVSPNQMYVYQGSYRESVGFDSWNALVGSDGSTGSYN